MYKIKQMMKYTDDEGRNYRVLLDKDDLSDISTDSDQIQQQQKITISQRHPKRQMALSIFLAISVLGNIVQFTNHSLFDLSLSTSAVRAATTELFWNPFEHLLNYHVQVFPTSFPGGRTAYMGPPSQELDDRWHNLYVEAFTLPKEQAAQLVNKTSQVDASNPDSDYVTSFSTMHYLHCLNGIRSMINFVHYPEHTNQSREHNQFTHGLETFPDFEDGGMLARDHIEHCVDHIRLALMCKPDLSPVVWQWRTAEEGGGDKAQLRPMLTTAHSCANYDTILEFARERSWNHLIESPRALDQQGGCSRTDQDCGYSKIEGNLLFNKDNYATEHGIALDPNNHA